MSITIKFRIFLNFIIELAIELIFTQSCLMQQTNSFIIMVLSIDIIEYSIIKPIITIQLIIINLLKIIIIINTKLIIINIIIIN